nr:hypothetical protein B0A51_11482 [Rachicladosporium sp. CCFEE 5018]
MKRGCGSRLEDALAKTLLRRKTSKTIRALSTRPTGSVDFSSNDFLSLATSKELREGFLAELNAGSSILGSGGSRLLDGNSTYAEALEKDIASFHGAETALLCNSGFDANAGLFSCLPQRGDIIVYDDFIHASVHDGMKLSRASKCLPFAHNSVAGLKEVLIDCLRDPKIKDGSRNVFIAVEGVYSMDGDVPPLSAIVDLIHELLPLGNGHLIVDEAHSTGVFGPRGSGLVCGLGLEKEVLVRLHTFGKALACSGAALLCSDTVRQYLINYARPLIYTTFLSYPSLAAIRASYTFLMQGETIPLQANLHSLIAHLHTRLLDLQYSLRLAVSNSASNTALMSVPTEKPVSPIFYVLSSEPKALAAYCQAKGFVVRGIVPPTVPRGGERVRICLHAGNTTGEIDGLVQVIGQWVQQQTRQSGTEDATAPKARQAKL